MPALLFRPASAICSSAGNKRELRLEAPSKAPPIGDRPAVRLGAHSAVQSAQRVRRRPPGQGRAALAQDNLDYYDKILKSAATASGRRHRPIDLDRLELQRLQYESDLQTAQVNLRTAKINLLALLDDRTARRQLRRRRALRLQRDLLSLDDYRKVALDARPDLRAAVLR